MPLPAPLQLPDQAKPLPGQKHRVDDVDLVPTVVTMVSQRRVGMMIIVPAFTEIDDGDQKVIPGVADCPRLAFMRTRPQPWQNEFVLKVVCQQITIGNTQQFSKLCPSAQQQDCHHVQAVDPILVTFDPQWDRSPEIAHKCHSISPTPSAKSQPICECQKLLLGECLSNSVSA